MFIFVSSSPFSHSPINDLIFVVVILPIVSPLVHPTTRDRDIAQSTFATSCEFSRPASLDLFDDVLQYVEDVDQRLHLIV